MEIGKVAAPAAGNQNLFAEALGPLQHGHAPSALAGFNGAHQAGRAAAENDYIELESHGWLVPQRNHGEHHQANRHNDVPYQQCQQPAAQALFTSGSHIVERFKV
jgi:hypothetical protein